MIAALQRADLVRASELQIRLWVDDPFRQPDQVDPVVRRCAEEMNRAALAKGAWVCTLLYWLAIQSRYH